MLYIMGKSSLLIILLESEVIDVPGSNMDQLVGLPECLPHTHTHTWSILAPIFVFLGVWYLENGVVGSCSLAGTADGIGRGKRAIRERVIREKSNQGKEGFVLSAGSGLSWLAKGEEDPALPAQVPLIPQV